MTSVAYEIYYSTENQGPRTPLTADEITWAIQRFPEDCEHRLPPGSSVSIAVFWSDRNSAVVGIHSPAPLEDIQTAVAASAESLQLCGARTDKYVCPRRTNPGEVDLSWMMGRTITDVSFNEPERWSFSFGEKGYISVECPWRILNEGRRTLSRDDHEQQYGLPAPIDAAAEAMKLLSAVVIVAAQLRVGTSDISIDFSGNLRLEIIPMSIGYEGWQMMDPFGTEFFAQGGGQITIWEGGR